MEGLIKDGTGKKKEHLKMEMTLSPLYQVVLILRRKLHAKKGHRCQGICKIIKILHSPSKDKNQLRKQRTEEFKYKFQAANNICQMARSHCRPGSISTTRIFWNRSLIFHCQGMAVIQCIKMRYWQSDHHLL